jgi:hypothetical protein
MFVEPALFLVRRDRTLLYVSLQSMPFGRPCSRRCSRPARVVAVDFDAVQ